MYIETKKCIRKLYILGKDGFTDMNLEFHPSLCTTAVEKLSNFIKDNGIDVVLYKGGNVEKDICDKLDMESFNIELFDGMIKTNSNEPCEEVTSYYNQLIHIGCF